MSERIDLNKIYEPSDDVVAREIEGETVIVPLSSGIGDIEDELYTLNDTGQEIWRRLDGRRSPAAIVEELAGEYDAPAGLIEGDVVGLLEELLARKMIVEKG